MDESPKPASSSPAASTPNSSSAASTPSSSSAASTPSSSSAASTPSSSSAASTPNRATSEFLVLHRAYVVREVAAVAALILALIFLRWESITNLGLFVLGSPRGDGGLYLWLTKSNGRDLFSLPWFNTSAFYPYTRTLAWSDNFILPSLLTSVLKLFGCSSIAAYNLTLLLAEFLNGYCMYLLARTLVGNLLPPLFAGLAFLSWNYFSAQLGHPQLQFAFPLPLALLTTLRYISAPSALRASLISLSIVLGFLCSVNLSVIAAVAVAVLFAGLLLVRPSQLLRRDYFALALGGIVGSLPLLPFLGPYLEVLKTFHERQYHEAFYFSASALSFLTSSPLSFFYGFTQEWSHAEAYLFPGIIVFSFAGLGFKRLTEARKLRPIVLSFVTSFLLACFFSTRATDSPWWAYLGIAATWSALSFFIVLARKIALLEKNLGFLILTNRGLISLFFFLALVGFALSLGPGLVPDGWRISPSVYALFYELFPGVSSVRAVGRFGILVQVALIMAATLALAHLLEKRRTHVVFAGIAAFLAVVENLPTTYPLEPEEIRSSVFEYLDQTPKSDEALLVLPLTSELTDQGEVKSWTNFALLNVQYMHWTFPLGRNIVNGYSGQRSKMMKELPKAVRGFPDERSLRELSQIAGLRYVLYVSKFDPLFDKVQFFKRAEQVGAQLVFRYGDDAANYLFEIQGPFPLTDETIFKVPSYPRGRFSIELLALRAPATPELVVDAFLPDFQGEKPFASVVIKADGEPAVFGMDLPATSDSVRPLRLRIQPRSKDFSVFFRRTRFTPGPAEQQ